jgi:hypothetical protein
MTALLQREELLIAAVHSALATDATHCHATVIRPP